MQIAGRTKEGGPETQGRRWGVGAAGPTRGRRCRRGPGARGRRAAAGLRAAECLRPCARPAPPGSVGCGRRGPAGGAASGGGEGRLRRGGRGACTRTHPAGLGGSASARGAGRGRARRWRGPRVSHCPLLPAARQPSATWGTARPSSPLGRRRGGGAGRAGAPHSGADLERVAGWVCCCWVCFSSCGLGGLGGEEGRVATSPTGISAVSLGPGWDVGHRAEWSGRGCRRPPGARLRPLEGGGAEGRGGWV